MRLGILISLWLLLLSQCANADEIKLAPDHPQTYTVVEGDTLWDIAGRFLAKPWQWPEIWHENPQIDNPHWIYPGDILTLTYVDGKPRLQVTQPSEQRLSPQVRATPTSRAIPLIPVNAIRPFLTQPKVVEAGVMNNAPYIVALADDHVVGGTGDRIYVRAIEDTPARNFMVFRPGPPYRDAITQEILGYEALYVGAAELQTGGDPATLLLTATQREAFLGDRLLPVGDEKLLMQYQPHAPSWPLAGHIISVVDGVYEIGQYQIVVIDRGTANGVETGHLLEIYQEGLVQRDVVPGFANQTVTLPREKEGLLMVFRPFERVSFALVMKATRAIHLRDVVKAP